VATTVAHAPFVVFGRDHNVILETIKRGDLDALDGGHAGPRTIVLRLYEAYGGHACVCLQVNVPGVVKAYATNLLEDDDGAEEIPLEQTTGEWGEQPGRFSLRLSFRGFEAKTVKLVLAKQQA
jgi:alpha-mannosidase